MKLKVSKHEKPIRLIDYCKANLFEFFQSKNAIVKAIKRQELLLNGEATSGSLFLKEGDLISYEKQDVSHHKQFEMELEIIYEDEYLAIVNKPAGYDVSGNKFLTIQNALTFNLQKSKESDALPIPRPVHRLDNQTSGILVIAKTHLASMNISKQFENKEVEKTYLSIVKGDFTSNLTVSTSIDEQASETDFELVEALDHRFLGQLSLVKAMPKTGRKHQIRKHLSENDFPILGDKLYGEHFDKGLFLFAQSIEFLHPISNKKVYFDLDLPNKFKTIIKHSGTGQEK